MKIRELKGEELLQYDAIATASGSVFNRLDYLRIFGGAVIVLGVFNNNNELIGGATFGQRKRFGLRALMAQPNAPATGPFFRTASQGGVKLLEERRSVVEALVEWCGSQNFAVQSIPVSPEISDLLPFIWRDYKVVPRYTFRIDLSQGEDAIFKNMSGDARNMIKKANKDNLRCERVDDMTDVISLVTKTFARQKMDFRESVDRKILFEFAKPDNSAAFVTYVNDKPSAAVFTIRDKKTCYYLLGGYDAENKHNGAGPLAIYKAILQAKADGCEIFDFEGSIVPQIEKYFRGFGGKLTPYFVANKAWLPLEMLLKPFKRRMF